MRADHHGAKLRGFLELTPHASAANALAHLDEWMAPRGPSLLRSAHSSDFFFQFSTVARACLGGAGAHPQGCHTLTLLPLACARAVAAVAHTSPLLGRSYVRMEPEAGPQVLVVRKCLFASHRTGCEIPCGREHRVRVPRFCYVHGLGQDTVLSGVVRKPVISDLLHIAGGSAIKSPSKTAL